MGVLVGIVLAILFVIYALPRINLWISTGKLNPKPWDVDPGIREGGEDAILKCEGCGELVNDMRPECPNCGAGPDQRGPVL